LEEAKVCTRIIDGWLSLQDYAVSKWFQHLNALAIVYNEEGFNVEDSREDALQRLYVSTSSFLGRYADEILEESTHDSVKKDYAKLAKLPNQKLYNNLTQVMTHVTRYMEKGPSFRNDICITSLKEAFGRNRKLIEELPTRSGSSRKSSDRETLIRYYGSKHFKCSFVTCIEFYEGFMNSKARDKHVDKHNRPWVCEVPHCTSASFGFTSNKELDKHKRDFHPDNSDLSALFNLTPKKVIDSSNHVCHICGKMFSRKYLKEDHIKSHMGEKPYACTECGKCFTRNNDRKRHEKIHDKR
jgi:hypothetical protein